MSDPIPPTSPGDVTPARLGAVRLRVADLERSTAFYTRAIGLVPVGGDVTDGLVRLGAPDGTAIVELESDPDAPPRRRGAGGLFHLAILVPSRRDLAEALARAVGAGARFSGASDHLVSEALYLNDPEGNGIEIYRDRPRDEWPRASGAVRMDTLPMDVEGVMATLGEAAPASTVPAGTTLGHVHLMVESLDTARRFYVGVVGFDVMVDTYPGALFVAAGGYHHHVGLNVWMSDRPADEGARGLAHYEIVVAGPAQVAQVRERAAAQRVPVEEIAGGIALRDAAANRVHVFAA